MQHMIAHGGNSPTKLFSNLITSSIFFPHQYKYNDPIPEVYFLSSLAPYWQVLTKYDDRKFIWSLYGLQGQLAQAMWLYSVSSNQKETYLDVKMQ